MTTQHSSRKELPAVGLGPPDLTLMCSDRSFDVHRMVLSLRSKVFNAMFGGAFRECTQSKLTLHDDDPDALSSAIIWMYCGLYPYKIPIASYDGPTTFTMCHHASVYALADKYNLETLASHAQRSYKALLPEFPRTYRNDARTMEKFNDFFESVRIVYSSTPESNRGLRDLISNHLMKKTGSRCGERELMKWELLQVEEEFHSLLEDEGELKSELFELGMVEPISL